MLDVYVFYASFDVVYGCVKIPYMGLSLIDFPAYEVLCNIILCEHG
jgi:hypothetical protein